MPWQPGQKREMLKTTTCSKVLLNLLIICLRRMQAASSVNYLYNCLDFTVSLSSPDLNERCFYFVVNYRDDI